MHKDTDPGLTRPGRYAYFPGCSMESAGGYAQSLDALCRALGLELPELPGWQCCGASAFFSIDHDEAVSRVARTLALAEREGATQIVTGCNGCYSTLRKGRAAIIADQALKESIRRELLSQDLTLGDPVPVRHVLEVLSEDVEAKRWEDARREGRPLDMSGMKVAAYYGCLFSRCPGSMDDPEHPAMLDSLLERLGFELVEHGARTACCGASHALPHGRTTAGLVERIIRSMRGRGATVAATICPLCQLNLDSGQRGQGNEMLPVLFVTQLAGLALGLPVEDLGLDKLLVRPRLDPDGKGEGVRDGQ
jgi:heterodisulfide reductase subunit B2